MSNCIIKIPDALYDRLKALAGKQGYSSAEEMINHILEKTVDGDLSDIVPTLREVGTKPEALSGPVVSVVEPADEAKTESIKRQLKGLGYFNG